MSKQTATIACRLCHGSHVVSVNEAQIKGVEPVVLLCDRLDRRYRLMGFYIDTRRNFFEPGDNFSEQMREEQRNQLKGQLGHSDFPAKFSRWMQVKYPPLGLIEEYSEKIQQIITAYAMGLYYPAVTSCCCLVERVLNRLVIKTRDDFKHHKDHKKVHAKHSLDNWPIMIDTLLEWGVITSTAANEFRALIKVRNTAIHYKDGYDFEAVAASTIDHCIGAITEVFGVINRKDLYLVFDVPGEVWVRKSAEDSPFVKAFVLPHCYRAYAAHEVDLERRRIEEFSGPIGLLSDAEFVENRRRFLEGRREQ